MAQKPGYTLEQHKILGSELKTIRNKLADITCELSEAYPFKISDTAKKAYLMIDQLCMVMDNKVRGENRSLANVSKIYNLGDPPW